MKTILGFSSAALAGATAQSIAAAANSGHTAVLNLRFTILYAFVRLFLTGWDLLLGNGERPRASEDDRPASGTSLRLILVVALVVRPVFLGSDHPLSLSIDGQFLSRRCERIA